MSEDMNKEGGPTGGGRKPELSRREALKLGGLVLLGLTSAACGVAELDASDLTSLEATQTAQAEMYPMLSEEDLFQQRPELEGAFKVWTEAVKEELPVFQGVEFKAFGVDFPGQEYLEPAAFFEGRNAEEKEYILGYVHGNEIVSLNENRNYLWTDGNTYPALGYYNEIEDVAEFVPVLVFRPNEVIFVSEVGGEQPLIGAVGQAREALVSNASIAQATATAVAETESAPFPESFRAQLTEWAAKQEDYKEIVISPSSEGGYDVTIQKEDGSTEAMFRLDADGTRVHLTADGEEVIVDIASAGTKDLGGYNKFFFGVEPEENKAFMWRYPWGGWVANWDKEFTENGVSIIANEAELYGGLFTINTEKAEELWEGFVGGIYQVNVATRNTALLSKYPTRESFLEAARSGVEISNVRIPIRYPDRQTPQFEFQASWEEIGPVDLSSAALGVPQMSPEENLHYNALEQDYILVAQHYLHFKVEENSRDGVTGLQFIAKSQHLNDFNDFLSLGEDKTREENFSAITQDVNIFVYFLNEFKDIPNAYILSYEHPLLNTATIKLTREQWVAMQNIETSFLKLRD